MKPPANATLLLAVLSTSGCQTIPSEDAALCSQIAQFANSTNDSATHSVELITDWGGQFVEKKANEIILSRKTCNDSGYLPAEKLCGYLLQHSLTEFPDANVNAVLVCLGAGKPTKMVYDLDYGQTELWSHVAHGVNPNILVGIEYSVGSDSTPPSLKILARREH